MYCFPSLPWNVLGTDDTDPLTFTVHSSLPLLASKARNRESSVAPIKTNPLAVAMEPPMLGRPVFCFSGGRVSVIPSGTLQAMSPVLTLTATSSPHGGCWHIMLEALSLNRPPGPIPR